MAVSDFSEFRRDKMGRAVSPPEPGMRGGKGMGDMRMKPSTSNPELPGKGQPRDRSAGVTRAKVHPQSKGL